MTAPTTQIQAFRGLNNVTDPVRLKAGWLTRADNIDISDTGRITRRAGRTLAKTGSFSGAYTTDDHSRFFVVDGGDLQQVHADLSATTLYADVGTAPVSWAEVNHEVYFSTGGVKGVIGVDNVVRPWVWPVPSAPALAATSGSLPAGLYQVVCTFILADGRETGAGYMADIWLSDGQALTISGIPQKPGATTQVYITPANSAVFGHAFATTSTAATWDAGPDSLGANLTTQHLSPPPADEAELAHWAGRMFLMQHMPGQDTTVVWFSQPLAPHLFDYEKDFFIVRGRGVLLAAHAQGLIVGTDTTVYGYDGANLTQLASYGAVPGQGAVIDTEDDAQPLLFWTQRGVCTAFPFANLTASRLSVAPGVRVGTAIVGQGGARKFIASLHAGGTAFNARSYP